MKKSICLFLALCILLSLCACGKTESADTLAEAEPEMVESWIAETIPAPALYHPCGRKAGCCLL